MIGCTFRFQPKHDPSSKWFRGQYLQRRYKTNGRDVILWKSVLETTASPAERLRMAGSGWIVIQHEDSTDSLSTSVQMLSRFSPSTELQNGIGAIQENPHDERVSIMSDFVLLVSEAYTEVAAQMVLMQ